MIKDLTQDKNMFVYWLNLIYDKLVEISKQPKYTTEKTKKLTEVFLPICKNRLKNNDKNSI